MLLTTLRWQTWDRNATLYGVCGCWHRAHLHRSISRRPTHRSEGFPQHQHRFRQIIDRSLASWPSADNFGNNSFFSFHRPKYYPFSLWAHQRFPYTDSIIVTIVLTITKVMISIIISHNYHDTLHHLSASSSSFRWEAGDATCMLEEA